MRSLISILDFSVAELDALIQTAYDIIENPEKISEYSRKAFECGMKNHNAKDIEKIFVSAFVRAANK